MSEEDPVQSMHNAFGYADNVAVVIEKIGNGMSDIWKDKTRRVYYMNEYFYPVKDGTWLTILRKMNTPDSTFKIRAYNIKLYLEQQGCQVNVCPASMYFDKKQTPAYMRTRTINLFQ